jgi:flagellar hook-associated protein 2
MMSTVSPTSSSSSNPATSSASSGSGIVSSTGLGSGVDINSIVTALVNAEGTGQTNLIKSQQSALNGQITAYSQLTAAASAVQTAVDSLTSSATFNSYAATVADTTIASASVSASAVPGSYSLSVTQLAQGATLSSGAFSSTTATVGTGTLNIAVGSSSFTVKIDTTNNTLSGIAAAINSATGNPGVSATIITGNDGAHLVLSSQVTGAANTLSVTQSGGDGNLNSIAYTAGATGNGLTQTQAAQDAILTLNGYTYNSKTNAVTTALTGVTINLLAASKSGATTTLTVAADPSGPAGAIATLIKSYNSLIGVVGQLDQYDATTGTSTPLFGSSLLQGFRSQISSIVTGGIPGAQGSLNLTSLAQIGITVNLDGTLSSDSNQLTTALKNNAAGVTALFTSAKTGIATRLSNVLFEYTSAGGIVDQTVKSLKLSLTDLANQQTSLNARLADLQASLYATYNHMDLVVSQLKATGNSINAQLAALPTYYGPTNSSNG